MKVEYGKVKEILYEVVESMVQERFCQRCLGKLSLRSDKTNTVRCSKARCRFESTLIKNKPFFNAKISWITLAQIIFLFINNSSCKIICFITGISNRTIGRILARVGKLVTGNQKIGGQGIIVEIDESKFGKRKYNKGHRVDGVWVLGMVERTPERKIVLIKLKNRKAESLTAEILRYVRPGSTIYTDCWKGYCRLSNNGYNHRTVNHSVGFVDRETGVHTNTIEGSWAGVKVNIPVRYRNKRDISRFMELFSFKRNNRTNVFKKLLNVILR